MYNSTFWEIVYIIKSYTVNLLIVTKHKHTHTHICCFFSFEQKFDCWNSFNDVWCPTTTKLQLDVLESDHYHYQFDTKDKYDFSVDINPFCTPIKEKVNPASKFHIQIASASFIHHSLRKSLI